MVNWPTNVLVQKVVIENYRSRDVVIVRSFRIAFLKMIIHNFVNRTLSWHNFVKQSSRLKKLF